MALPKIEPLSSEFEVTKDDSNAVKLEIEKLGQAIFEKTNTSLKSATQAVISDVPSMIQTLTQEIESGPIDTFGNAINKLVRLTQDLGINLYDYNEQLGKTVDRFIGKQEDLEKELSSLREKGIRAEINERGDAIKILTQKEIQAYEKDRKENLKSIEKNKEEIETRTEILNNLKETEKVKRKEIENEIKSRNRNIEGLEKENEQIDKRTNTTADTGRDIGGFSKIAELKEAFMVIPDTIAEVATGFKDVGKSIFQGIAAFIGNPMKAISKAFKGIANLFRTARLMIALKVLAVIAALQFVAERIEMIGDVFRNIWGKITDFFKGIIDWFKNSKIGKLLGFGKGDGDEKPETKGYNKMSDDGMYGIGEDGSEIATTNINDEFLPASKDPTNAPVVDPVTKKIYKKGDPGYEKAYSRRFQTVQSYSDDEQSVNAMNELRSVVGDNVGDDKTSSMLKSLESESNNIKPPTIVNIQNNATSNSSQSNASNVSGFLTHEPDTTLKYVQQGSTGSADF